MIQFFNQNKKGIMSLVIVLMAFVMALLTSILLDLEFIKAHFVRQIIIYIAITVQLFISVRLIILINK